MMPTACALVLSALLASSDVPTQPPAETKKAPTLHALKFDWVRDGVGTAAVAGVLGGGLLFKEQWGSTHCRLCDVTPEGGDQLDSLDRWERIALRGRDAEARHLASQWSDTVANVMVPVGTLGAEVLFVASNKAPWPWLAEDGLILAESMMLSLLATDVVKFSSARLRPYAYASEVAGEHSAWSVDDFTSFYSGHTSFAFNLVVSLGTLAELRGYEGRWLVWAVGLPLAAAVAPLRMAADKHYLTDVLVGAVAGSAVGVAVPLLLHGRKQTPGGVSLRVTVAPGGAALMGRF